MHIIRLAARALRHRRPVSFTLGRTNPALSKLREMPDLRPRPLATSREDAPVNWVIHKMGSALVGEYFTGGYYRDCLTMAERMAPHHRPGLEAIHAS